MANKYSEAKGILLNNGSQQLLPVSKAQLIELANADKTKFTGYNVTNATSVEDALTYLLNKGNSDLEAAKTYTGTSIEALDSTITASYGYVFSGITEVDGKLTGYTETWLDASVITYNGASHVDTALTDIYGKLAAISGTGSGSIQDQIKSALNVLDLNEVKKDGQAIVAVSQADGTVSASVGNIKAQYVDVDNTNDKFKTGDNKTTLTTQATLEHLQGEITSAVKSAAKYNIKEVTEGLGENVAKRYKLLETVNNAEKAVGADIDIPKDSSLKEVYLGSNDDSVNAATGKITKNTVNDPQSMNFVYHLANGTYSLTKIDVSKFLSESEFKNGLSVDNHTVSVKLAYGSETFLTVDSDGVKLSGVQFAINTAEANAKTYATYLIEGLDSAIAEKTENDFSYVMTGVTETDGKLTAASYIGLTDENVKTTTFDSESDLYKLLGSGNLPTNLHDALNKIAGKISDNGGNAVTSVTGDNNNTYVNVTAAKSGNTVTLTVDDKALGNVAKLHYDDLGSAEVASIFKSNPEK